MTIGDLKGVFMLTWFSAISKKNLLYFFEADINQKAVNNVLECQTVIHKIIYDESEGHKIFI